MNVINQTIIYKESINFNPVTAILGPRQCGKTTIARLIAEDFPQSTFFDLEDPADFELMKATPKSLLMQQKGLIIIDEIQLIPELFPLLRVLADEANSKRKFLILGSASPDLMQKSSESLAGKIGVINLTGFRLNEIGNDELEKLWLRGGFPRSFLANAGTLSRADLECCRVCTVDGSFGADRKTISRYLNRYFYGEAVTTLAREFKKTAGKSAKSLYS